MLLRTLLTLLSLLMLHIFLHQHYHINLIYLCDLPYSVIANAGCTVPTHFTPLT